MENLFKQGNELVKCTITSVFNPELSIFGLIDSSWINPESLSINSDLIDDFCDMVENEVFDFYELNGEDEDSNSFDGGYRYSFTVNHNGGAMRSVLLVETTN